MARANSTAASRRPQIDVQLDDYPPFPGFDPIGFKFLRSLKKYNRREWLTEDRKLIYRDHLVEPMRCLLNELRQRFQAEAMPFAPDPRSGMFRLYRDTRFSKDKTPFKTNIGAVIPWEGETKEGVGNYVHIEPGDCFFGGGAYFIESASLKNLRAAIDRDPERLRGILRELAESFSPMQGEQLKRAPVGYDEHHQAIDLLRYKQMWAGLSFDEELAGSRELVDWLVEKSRSLMDFDGYLHEAIRGVVS